MSVARTSLVVQDRPGAFWLLGGTLLGGGVLILASAFGFVESSERIGPGLQVLFVLGGVVVLWGAVWWLRQSPRSRAEVSLVRSELSIVRIGIGGRHVRIIPLADVQAFAVERNNDDEGGEVVRPVARMTSTEAVPLSMLWSHDTAGVRATVAELGQFCGKPAHELDSPRD